MRLNTTKINGCTIQGTFKAIDSTDRNGNKTKFLLFYNGTTVELPKQTNSKSLIKCFNGPNSQVQIRAYNIEGATINGSHNSDNIRIYNCKNSTINTANDDSKDETYIYTSDKNKISNNRIISGNEDYSHIDGYHTDYQITYGPLDIIQ